MIEGVPPDPVHPLWGDKDSAGEAKKPSYQPLHSISPLTLMTPRDFSADCWPNTKNIPFM